MKNSAIIRVAPLDFIWETQDPFLFCVYHEDDFPQGDGSKRPNVSLRGRDIGQDFNKKDGWRMYHGDRIPGFPAHPHRGFETVTVVTRGFVDHADSLGAAGRYGEGDTQWMTAGKGVQHSEMFPMLKEDTKNPLELFQLWLNLPAKDKMTKPHFSMLWDEKTPKYTAKDDQGNGLKIRIVAGKLESLSPALPPPNSWAADPENKIAIWIIQLDANANWEIPKEDNGINRTVYFYDGDVISINEQAIEPMHLIDLKADHEVKIQAGHMKCQLLILQGRPINEPVAQHGPFVMNTNAELQQAYNDYHETQFGGWPWPDHDQTHPLEKSRFAKHADGVEEFPEKNL